MSLLDRFGEWLNSLFRAGPVQRQQQERPLDSPVPAHFPAVIVVERPPGNEQVAAHQLYYVVTGDRPKWSLFKCPCGCGDVITLSLQPVHTPHWNLTKANSGGPTLYPSVWRDKGCFSHFWVKAGRISWCPDTGSCPDSRGHR
jgi:Family of unknown function (DUF6527)